MWKDFNSYDFFDSFRRHWRDFVSSGLFGPVFGAVLGRWICFIQNERKFKLAFVFLVELPTTMGMAVISWGLADYFSLTLGGASALGVIFGYFGTRTLDILLNLLRLKLGEKNDPN